MKLTPSELLKFCYWKHSLLSPALTPSINAQLSALSKNKYSNCYSVVVFCMLLNKLNTLQCVNIPIFIILIFKIAATWI